MAAVAMIISIISWAPKEKRSRVTGGTELGLATIVFQPTMAIFAAIILAALIVGVLQGLAG